jgi:hypothetical protein
VLLEIGLVFGADLSKLVSNRDRVDASADALDAAREVSVDLVVFFWLDGVAIEEAAVVDALEAARKMSVEEVTLLRSDWIVDVVEAKPAGWSGIRSTVGRENTSSAV